MNILDLAERVIDVVEEAADDGIELLGLLSPERIARLELEGCVVDLVTGEIVEGGADLRYGLAPQFFVGVGDGETA